MVALNADEALGRAQNLGLACGPIRRIRIEDVRAESCHTFVRLLSVRSVIEDVEIDGVFGGWKKAQKTHFDDGGVFDAIYAR